QKWWAFETPGHAVAALEFASGLIYFQVENPIFRPPESPTATYRAEWSPACEVANKVWRSENVRFLRETLNLRYLGHKLNEARHRLRGEQEITVATKMLEDFMPRRGLVREKIEELLTAI